MSEPMPDPAMSAPPRAQRPVPKLALTISERAFQQAVIDIAHLRGWHVAHFRAARTGGDGWATPMAGDVGFPDLVLARRGRVILAELKTQHGRLTPAQRRWLEELGSNGRLWRPSDLPAIVSELR